MHWLMLSGAILTEVIATLSLRSLTGGLRPWPTLLVIAGYGVSFTLLTFALRSLNVGVAYAIWSGVGIAGVSIGAALLFGDRLNVVAVGGMALIVIGVVVLVSSGTATHA